MPFWKNDRVTPAQIIILGFFTLILAGTALLMLPFAVREGAGASFLDALFTATSATCVTGLVLHDTALYWSPFGQAVILLLIQVGGMGGVTLAGGLSPLSREKNRPRPRRGFPGTTFPPPGGGVFPPHPGLP